MMSFSSKTKNALARIIPEDKCCQIAELGRISQNRRNYFNLVPIIKLA